MKESTKLTIGGVMTGLILIIFISSIILLTFDEEIGLENIENLHECYGLLTDEKTNIAHNKNHTWSSFEDSFNELDCNNYYVIEKSKTNIKLQVEKQNHRGLRMGD